MAKKKRAYPPVVIDAALLLGEQVRDARLARRWPARELAGRAGISTDTLRKVETGDPSVALGTAFDVAALLGVRLFYERSRLAEEASRIQRSPLLLGSRVRPRADGNDDF